MAQKPVTNTETKKPVWIVVGFGLLHPQYMVLTERQFRAMRAKKTARAEQAYFEKLAQDAVIFDTVKHFAAWLTANNADIQEEAWIHIIY